MKQATIAWLGPVLNEYYAGSEGGAGFADLGRGGGFEEGQFANGLRVVGERGVIYLMGRVTQREAKRATDVVRGVGGVKRVVRVFEYITEDELRAM